MLYRANIIMTQLTNLEGGQSMTKFNSSQVLGSAVQLRMHSQHADI